MNEHRTVKNIAVYENIAVWLVSWLVAWLDSGAPTLVIWHHLLIRARTKQR